ncbi:MAG: DUF4445 domain-containing protein [Clostridiales bacterium]|nr:DUF4445 domain-containing protein [Clostridiales bacterium]
MDKANIYIQLVRGNKISIITCEEKESLLNAMNRQGIYSIATCGGKGTCGKCLVQVLEGTLEITTQDRKIIDEEELAKGYRLACQAYPKEDCKLRLLSGDESNFDIISVTDSKDRSMGKEEIIDKEYGIAVDIGTTTIAACLVGLTSKKIIETYTTINKQRVYGADVIARIKASNSGKRTLLRNCIRKDLLESFEHLLRVSGINRKLVRKIAIAGNTTMGHLLMGYSCMGLGAYPFKPVNIGRIKKEFKDFFGTNDLESSVTLLPGISAFVGGDITAGLAVSDFDKSTNPSLLVDLGTNGEMAIGTKERIIVSSTAAGPAFEGGNISCGGGSVAGAICSVIIEGGSHGETAEVNKQQMVSYKTIGDKPAVGICGTGVLEITSELLRNHLIDANGLLQQPYFEHGFPIAKTNKTMETMDQEEPIIVTQKDIREIQLAKAAIRAGIETLIASYGISYEQIGNVYLAGGFGYKINIDKAVHIGLLPVELSGKIKAIGNSSLIGAIQYLTDEGMKNRLEHIIAIAKELNLSEDRDFNNRYVKHMNFLAN